MTGRLAYVDFDIIDCDIAIATSAIEQAAEVCTRAGVFAALFGFTLAFDAERRIWQCVQASNWNFVIAAFADTEFPVVHTLMGIFDVGQSSRLSTSASCELISLPRCREPHQPRRCSFANGVL